MKWDGGSKYNIIGMLGKGAFATVHQLATKMDGRLLAAKELEKRRFMKNGMLDKKIDNEMKIMQGLRHPNIVEFIEYHDEGDYLYIVMEFARQGDLQAYLSQVGTVKEPVARSLAQQILSALAYLHRANITHRDIKPDNILISEIDPLTVKLSDFGLSKVVKHDETFLKTFCGTLLYCAPEVFPEYTAGTKHGTKRRRGAKQYHSYSSSVDIWSFGGVLWYALCGEPPFKGIADATGEAMFKNIMATPLDTTPLQRKGVSAVCIDLLTRMLRTDPALRPTDRECLNHPWLKEGARIPADPTLQSIVEVDEDDTEHQLSQMSLHVPSVCVSDDEYDEDILSDDEMLGMMTSKRVRADPRYPRNQARDHVSSADASFQSGLPIEEGESFRIMAPLRRPRLFGEIGQSALQSSGVLSARANDALPRAEVTESGPHDSVGGAERFYTPVGALHDRSSSSPGLGGTESMVRDLNMASPHSRTQSPAMPTTPGTPEVVQHNSLQQSSKDASQVSEPTPKARPTNRQFSLPRTASYFYDPSDPRTHNLEYATRVSGYNFVAAQQSTEAGASAYEDVGGQSDTSDHSGYSTAVGSAASPPGIASSHFAQPDIKPPPRRFGKLVATSDSFAPNLVLHISESQTSWGRLPSCTIVYPEGRDTRIPKTAFVVFFYSASESGVTVEQLAAEGKDWTTLPGLQVGIWACATRGISINGWNLKRTDDKGRALFGHLHTGDIIKVYQDAAGSEFLQFRCEFYLGAGKESRPVNESFTPLTGKKLEG
jgi:serine/threonine protein kinase